MEWEIKGHFRVLKSFNITKGNELNTTYIKQCVNYYFPQESIVNYSCSIMRVFLLKWNRLKKIVVSNSCLLFFFFGWSAHLGGWVLFSRVLEAPLAVLRTHSWLCAQGLLLVRLNCTRNWTPVNHIQGKLFKPCANCLVIFLCKTSVLERILSSLF